MAVGAFAREKSISVDSSYGQLPMSFEPNVGQTDRSVDFLVRGPGYTVFLTPGGAVVRKDKSVWKMRLEGPNPRTEAVGLEPSAARSHYLTGHGESEWHTDVPHFSRVQYRSVYPGVDMVYYGNQQQLEYDFVLAPGADPARIMLAFEDIQDVQVDAHGELVLQTSGGEVRQHKPFIYQKIGGTIRQVVGGFVVRRGNRVGFKIGSYDRSKPLVIDPVLGYSTYLGGFRNDAANAIAVDSAGNAYIAGWTESTDFPVLNPRQNVSGGGVDAFVAKVNASGALVYATYLGGRGDDRVFGITVDGSGAAVISGWTYSTDFPVYLGLQSVFRGGRDAFIAKLNAAGNGFVFSTYLGGNGFEWGRAVAIDQLGNIYATGETDSMNFPLLNPFQSSNRGRYDVFITKLSATGSLLYSTYLGGYGDESGTGITVDGGGNAYVTGSSDSTNLPMYNAFQSFNRGGQDVFVAKLNSAGNQLVYSTYLGGSGGTAGFPETGAGITVDAAGSAYIVGTTSSSNFPIFSAFRTQMTGAGTDAFVAKLNPWGNGLLYCTYLGGSNVDYGSAVTIDAYGNAYVTGYTSSQDFPTANPLQASNAGSYDAFVASLGPNGNALSFATYLGGNGSDSAYAIGVDSSQNIYIAGQTLSLNFPIYNAFQNYNNGSFGAFISRISIQPGATPKPSVISASTPSGGSPSFSATFTDSGGIQNLTWLQMLINSDLNGQNACWVQYHRPTNALALVNDTGTGASAPVVPGSAAALNNSQCTLYAAGSSVVISGNTLVLNVALSFEPTFTGIRKIYLDAQNALGQDSGWQQQGYWTAAVPQVISVSTPSGTNQTFSATFSDTSGYQNLTWLQMLINSNLNGQGACWIQYYRPTNALALVNNAGNAALGPIMPGTFTILENDQCVLNAAGSWVAVSGNNLVLNVALSFKPTFKGTRRIYMAAQDMTGTDSGWREMGLWIVP
jgi:hypothetical protein